MSTSTSRAAELEEIQLPGAPRLVRDARQRLTARQRIQQRGFADIGAARERDFRAARRRQMIERLCGIEKLAIGGEELAAPPRSLRQKPSGEGSGARQSLRLRASRVCRMISHCCPIDRRLFQAQYITSPAGKRASMKVKMIGMNWNMRACTGSGGGGFSFCCRNIVMPMMSGSPPRCRNGEIVVGSKGISPNRLNTLVGSTPRDRGSSQRTAPGAFRW